MDYYAPRKKVYNIRLLNDNIQIFQIPMYISIKKTDFPK